MTPDPVTATLPGSRTEVLRTLVKNKLTGLPVVGKDGALAGFVSRTHIFAKPEVEQLAMLMVRDYPSIPADATISELAKLLVEQDLHHLPVVAGDALVGIVTPADLMDRSPRWESIPPWRTSCASRASRSTSPHR
jgi:CBS domain-containing protein